MAKKILIVAFGFYPDPHGVAQAAYRQALTLHQMGYSVTVLTRNTTTKNLPFEVVSIHKKRDFQSFLKSSDADVVFFHGWHNWATDWAIPIFPLKGKTVLVSHGTNFNVSLGGWKGAWWWLRKRVEALLFPKKMARFDHFVFLSDKPDNQRMSDLILAENREMRNYSIIPNGANPDFKLVTETNFREKNNITQANMLLCVSNFHYAKGQGELINWFTNLALPDTALVLIGSEFNDFSTHLKNQAAHLLNQSIFLLEQLDTKELNAAYCSATVFVSATYTEVQPLMLLDAMTVGLPFLCRNVGVVSELEGGICFKTSDEFEEMLAMLLKGSFLRKSLGEKGKKAVEEQYNWGRIGMQYHQLIQNLVQSK